MASRFRVVKRIENAASDISFLEECARKGEIPKGFKWKFRAQGLKQEDEEKVEKIKEDAVLRIMDVIVKGLKEKKKELEKEEERMIEEVWAEKSGWERIRWNEEIDGKHKWYAEEARKRKEKKRKQMQARPKGTAAERGDKSGGDDDVDWIGGSNKEGKGEKKKGDKATQEEDKEEQREQEVVESWEMLAEEGERWKDLGLQIFEEEGIVARREEELKGLTNLMEREGVEMRYKTPMDGNCFFHAVGEQTGQTAAEVRREAVHYLRENTHVNGEKWSDFVVGGERGERAYLRTMAAEGQWTDHVMILATAKALKRRVIVYSQTEKTVIGESGDGTKEDVLVGFIREVHYFGVKRKQNERSAGGKEKGKGGKSGKKDGAVFNLGVEGLTEDMEDVLSLGLKFVPLQRVNKSKVEADVERLKIKLMWDVYWKWVKEEEEEKVESQRTQQGEGTGDLRRQEREKERKKERPFEGKTEKTPVGLPNRWRQAIDRYCEAVKEDIFTGLKRRPRDNLSQRERAAMGALQEKVKMKEWAVRPADKGGGITVEKYEGLMEDGFKELEDETTFEKRDRSGMEKISKEVEDKLKDMKEREVITKKMREFMSAKNKREGVMKINRKVHKKVKENGRHPTRVYISGIGTPTEGIAGLVEAELQEGVEKQKSYVQDTADFLRRLERVGKLNDNEFMFTMDVVALYPSVPREQTRKAMEESLEKRTVKKIPTKDLLELGDMVLRSNEFTFEEERYRQKEGTAIGSKMGKNYACTFMGVWEEEVQRKTEQEIGKKPRVWLRFVDDVWGVWRGTRKEFERFVEICNSHEERIKVTHEVCERESIFLDVKVLREEGGRLRTELYVKPTDRTRYLHESSDHPRHVKQGIAKGQFRRLRRICSEDEDYWKYSKQVEQKLISRGYGKTQVRQQMKESFKMGRKEAMERVEKREDRRVNFVLTHSGFLPNVNQIIKKHRHYLEEDGMERFIKELPRVSLRRGKNIGDLVVNAKSRGKAGGSGPCGKGCKLCGIMEKTNKVKDKEGKDMQVKGEMDCQTVGVVYGIHCKKCKRIIYVGKTKNQLRERFNGHRADLRMGDETKPAYHFRKEGHYEGDMRVIGLEHVPGNDDTYRITRERWWINKMGTFDGENRRK